MFVCRPVVFTYTLTYHIRTHAPHTHLRLFLSSNHHLLLDLDYLSLSQSHNSSSFSCCLILIKIPSRLLVLLLDLPVSFHDGGNTKPQIKVILAVCKPTGKEGGTTSKFVCSVCLGETRIYNRGFADCDGTTMDLLLLDLLSNQGK